MTSANAARQLNKWLATRKGPQLSLLQKAILEQLTPDAFSRPKLLIATYGSEKLAPSAFAEAKRGGATLVVCFIREVNLSYKWDRPLTIESDPAGSRAPTRSPC